MTGEAADVPDEPWRMLRVGDVVRVVRMPSGVDAPGYTFHRSTRRLYERLIASGKPFVTREVDQWGSPWIHIRVTKKAGPVAHHSLALRDDSWVREG